MYVYKVLFRQTMCFFHLNLCISIYMGVVLKKYEIKVDRFDLSKRADTVVNANFMVNIKRPKKSSAIVHVLSIF